MTLELHEALLSPEAYPVAVRSGVERIQTHISWVFLLQRDVYKLKRPVDLGFLDFRTLEKRRIACEAEVELNRRLARSSYFGVVPIVRTTAGRISVEGAGEVIDWAVHMRRLADAERADHLLAAGTLSLVHLDALAERLAQFHAEAACGARIAAWGNPEHVTQNVRENFAQTRDVIEHLLTRRQASELENWQRSYLQDHAQLFRERVSQRRVRDGHGDLRLEHVYLEASGITVLDCIEFNERFRYADVGADVAFLSMDLEALGRGDLAEYFLARYARHAGDFDLYALIDFYESYRAFVRAKVSAFVASDTAADYPSRRAAWERARHYALLALAAKRRPAIAPIVVAVGGQIASGKSTWAEQLGRALSAPIVDTDRIRKQLAGVGLLERLHAPAFAGAYSIDASQQVYGELYRRARIVIDSGRPVVVEASFRSAEQRRSIRALATDASIPFYFVECRASAELCQARLGEREKAPSVSDGRRDIAEAFAHSFEAVTELDGPEHVVIDTSHPFAANALELQRRLGVTPRDLTPRESPG